MSQYEDLIEKTSHALNIIDTIQLPEKKGNKETSLKYRTILSKTEFLTGSVTLQPIRDANSVIDIAALLQELQKTWVSLTPVIQAPTRSLDKGRSIDTRQGVLAFNDPQTIEIREPRIYLPVPKSRQWEVKQRGAHEESQGNFRSSNLWIPLSKKDHFKDFLPLAFQDTALDLSYPPIRPNAVGQNLWSIFDSETWKHIRFSAYDRSGHRCQLCGKQYGSLWSKITPESEKKKSGPVDCHEVWEWDCHLHPTIGVQRLTSFFVLCKDCHLTFHEGYALSRAREANQEKTAKNYLDRMRMAHNRISKEDLYEKLERDRVEWDNTRHIHTWILDVSLLGHQDYMSTRLPVLIPENRAGVIPETLAGINFQYNGFMHTKKTAEDLIKSATS